MKLFCDEEKRNRHNKFTVHSKTTHDLATQLTIATLALSYWRRVGEIPQAVKMKAALWPQQWAITLYSILNEVGAPIKPVRLIQMCLKDIYSKVCIGKTLSDAFPTQNDLN
jgi:hypothetical protein